MMRGATTLAAVAALILAACGGVPAVDTAAAPAVETAAAPVDPTTLVRNGRMPVEGLLTGGQPTDEQLAALRDAGFATVINLRTPNEPGVAGEAEKVAELGMAYVSIPVDGRAGLTEDNARALAQALEDAERPALLHCASGNRVGALLALKAFWLEGAGPEEALDAGLAGGVTRLEPAVRELLGLPE